MFLTEIVVAVIAVVLFDLRPSWKALIERLSGTAPPKNTEEEKK